MNLQSQRVLVSGEGFTQSHLDLLKDRGFDVALYANGPTEQQLLAELPTIHSYILGGDERLTDDLLRKASGLKRISFVGKGVSSFVDLQTAAELGIDVRNTPDVMVNAVVEHTLGFVVGLRCGLFAENHAVKRGLPVFSPSREVRDSRVAVYGMGAIGAEVARRLVQAFGCDVRYYSRTRKADLEEGIPIAFSELDQLLPWAEIHVLMLPTTQATTEFLGEREFARMAPGSILVNTAGAQLVVPEALDSAIERGTIACAAFDGYFEEPLPKVDDDRWGLLKRGDNTFVVTPHTAAKTTGTWQRMITAAIDNVL